MKKLKQMLCLMLTVVMLASVFMPLNAFAENKLSATLYAFDENGNSVSNISGLKDISANVLIYGNAPQNSTLYVAVYDGNKLESVETKKLDSRICPEFNLSLPGTTTQKIKAFVWDGSNIPLTAPFSTTATNTAYIDNTQHIQSINATKYYSIIGTGTMHPQYLSVFNPDEDRINTIYDLDFNAQVYVNGKYLAPAYDSTVLNDMHGVTGGAYPNLGKYYAPNLGNIKLIDTDNDSDYDFLFVKSYETVIVDEVYNNNTRISTKNAGTIALDTALYNITMDGKKIDIADLKEWDVLSIAVTADCKNYEILGTRTPVQGMINAMDTVNGIYEINEKEYTIANMAYPSEANLWNAVPGDEGTFYIDTFGKIAYFDKTSYRNYGFIVGAGDFASVGDVAYEIMILGKDGTMSTYTLADNVKITEYGYSRTESAASVYNNYIRTLMPYNNGSWIYKDANPTVAMLQNYASRLITYRANSSGKISAIGFADYSGYDINSFNYYGYTMGAEYKESLDSLGTVGVSEDTIVFSLPVKANSTKDDFGVTDINSLTNGTKYDVAYFDVYDDFSAKAVVIVNPEIKLREDEEEIITDMGYGFITGAGNFASVGDVAYEVQILGKDGTMSTYTLADNVKVTDYNTSATPVTERAYNVYNNYIKSLAYGGYDWMLTPSDGTAYSRLNNYASRLVKYSVNSSGKISAITCPDTTPTNVNSFNFNGAATNVEFMATLGALGQYGVTEDTIVFNLPISYNSGKDEFAVTTINTLGDGNNYDVAYFDVDEDGNAGVLVITNCDATIGYGAPLSVLTKVMVTKNEDYETVCKLTFLQNGEEKTLTTTADLYNIMNFNYTCGDVFEYAVNSKGEMCDIAFGCDDGIMLTPNSIDYIHPNTTTVTKLDAAYDYNATGNAPQYVFGGVYAKNTSRVVQIADFSGGALVPPVRHKIDDDANITIVDLSRPTTSLLRVQTGEYGDIQPMYFDNNGKISDETDVSLLMKYYKDKVTDVVVYLHYGEYYSDMYVNKTSIAPLTPEYSPTVYIDNTQHIQLIGYGKYASILGYNNAVVDSEGNVTVTPSQFISVFNADKDKANTVYALDDNAQVYVNGKYLAPAYDSAVLANMHAVTGGSNANLGKYYAPNSGNIKLIDTDNDYDYDELYVKSYETVIVDETYARNTKISTKNAGVIDLDFEGKKGYTYSITMDGEEIGIADLKEWDVLSIAVTADKKNYEIIGTRTTVEGAIDELDTVNGIYKVNGTEYKVANMADPWAANLGNVTPGDEGILYVDSFGGIAYFDRTSATSRNYGFIVGAGDYASVGDVTYEVQILDRDGTIATYTLADNVRVTDYNTSVVPATETAANVYNNRIKNLAFGGSAWTLTTANGTASDRLANYAARLVTYTVNSQSKISAIAFADATPSDVNNFNFDGATTGVEFKATLGALGQYGVTEDTVVFSLPVKATTAKDDFEVTTIDVLGDGDNYDVAYFNVDEDGNAGAIVITNCDASIGAGSSLAVVTKIITTVNKDYEHVYRVTFLQGGEEKTLATTADLYNVMGSNYACGDVFEYAVNSKGEMSDIAFGEVDDVMLTPAAIASINPNATTVTGLDAAYDASTTGNAPQYVFGGVYAKTTSRVIQIADMGNGWLSYPVRHKIPDNVPITIVDLTKSTTSSTRVQTGAYGDIQSFYFDPWGRIDPDRDVCVLLKYYKDAVTDVIIYKGYAQFYGGFSVIW